MKFNTRQVAEYQKAKQNVINARKQELDKFLNKPVRVFDSRHDITALLRYDHSSEKYHLVVVGAEIEQNTVGFSIVSFYPTEVETVSGNVIRLCEV